MMSVCIGVFMLALQATQAFNPFSKGRRSCLRQYVVYASDPFDLFASQHTGAWRGVWETFDQIGDSIDTQEILFDAKLSADGNSASLSQTMVVGSKQADCETCFDSQKTKTLPLGTLARGKLGRTTLVGPAFVTGPSVLRSGAMSTELALRYAGPGDGRVRVTITHAPAWAKDNPNGPGPNGSPPPSGPPDALDLVRVTVRREALRPEAPTAERELATIEEAAASTTAAGKTSGPCPRFWRGVPPFKWGERDGGKWEGSTFTWDNPSVGKVSSSASESAVGGSGGGGTHTASGAGAVCDDLRVLDWECPADVWHERFTGDDDNTWYLRLGGGILVQTPQRVFNSYTTGAEDSNNRGSRDDTSEQLRYELKLAWLAEDDALLRCCAEVTALETAVDEASGAVAVSPPTLKRVTVDSFKKPGEPDP